VVDVSPAAIKLALLLTDEELDSLCEMLWVCSRVRELHSAATVTLEISSRNSRVAALQKRWDRLRAGLDLLLDERDADMADLPGGASGLLVRDYKGKKADRLVARIDPGIIPLVTELRGHERQAAEELEQWKAHHEERKVIDASPAAITLVLLLTDEELDSLEKGAGDGGGGRPGGSDVASPQPAARHGEPTQVFPPMPRPPTGDRGWIG
jgi:hypothetical protein